jgi:Microcystin-dependent protein
MAEPFTGQISIFGFDFAPYRWQQCTGQLVPIAQNTALFSLLGTYYGGNGTSTFGLPNMQGNVAVGKGQLPGGQLYDLGETGGTSSVAVSRPESPTHSHDLMGTATVATTAAPAGKVLAKPQVSGSLKNTVGNLYNTNAVDTPLNAPISPAGNGQPHENRQPFLVLNYCICVQGIFPQRG